MNLVRAAGFVGVVLLWSAAPSGAQCGVNMTCNPPDTPAGSAPTDAAASAPSGGPSFGQCGVNMTCNPSDTPAAVRPAPNFFATPDGSGSSAPNFFATPDGSGSSAPNFFATPDRSGSSAPNFFATPDRTGPAPDFFDFIGAPAPPAESAVPGVGVCGVNMSCNPPDPTESKKPDPKPEPKPERSAAPARKRAAAAASSDDSPVFGKTPWGAETLTGTLFREIHDSITAPCNEGPCSRWRQRQQQREKERALDRLRRRPSQGARSTAAGSPSGQERREPRRR